MIAYRKGDQKSLEILIGRYLGQIHVFIRRLTGNDHDAEDIVQEAFVKAWRNLWRFDSRRRFRPWMFRIAKNAAVDHLRKRRTVPFSSFEDERGNNILADSLTDDSPLPDELLNRKDIGQALAETIGRLPITYREVLILRHHDGFAFGEIAEITKCSVNTAKSRHRRGLAMLRTMLCTDSRIKGVI